MDFWHFSTLPSLIPQIGSWQRFLVYHSLDQMYISRELYSSKILFPEMNSPFDHVYHMRIKVCADMQHYAANRVDG